MAETFETFLYWSSYSDPNNTVTDSPNSVWYLNTVPMEYDYPVTPFDDSIWYSPKSLDAQIKVYPFDIFVERLHVKFPPLSINSTTSNKWTIKNELSYTPFFKYKVSDYTSLVTWQHKKPKFLAVLEAIIQPYVDIQNTAWDIEARGFNVDTSSGRQLDIIGEIVGLSRHISMQIPHDFFGWGFTPDSDPRNWNIGVWADNGEIPLASYSLDDSIYRFFLKIKIVLNYWDGSVNGLYEAFQTQFRSDEVQILCRDNMDMSITITLRMNTDNEIYPLLFKSNYLHIKPAGVAVNYKFADLYKHFWVDKIKDAEFGVWDDGIWTTYKDRRSLYF